MSQVAATTPLGEVELLRMQVARLLARVASKDAEFSKERTQLKHRILVLERELRELKKGVRHAA